MGDGTFISSRRRDLGTDILVEVVGGSKRVIGLEGGKCWSG